MHRLLLFALLFLHISAFAVSRKVRGYVLDNSTDAVIFMSEAIPLQEPVSYFLRGENEGVNKQLREMKAGEAYEIMLVTNSVGKNLTPAYVLEITKVAFRGAGVGEPTAGDPRSIPRLDIDDHKLADRAHVYSHYLNDNQWVSQFLNQSGDPLQLKTMRKTVILNALFTEVPTYPRKIVDEERDLFVDAAVELWELGDGKTLRLIQEMIFDRLDVEPKPIEQDYSCNMMLKHISGFKDESSKLAAVARIKVITHLDNMAIKLPTVSIDHVLEFPLK